MNFQIKLYLLYYILGIGDILILEGDKNKISLITENNTIVSCLFFENYLESDIKNKFIFEKGQDKIISYVINLLENYPNDVRDYISHNMFNETSNNEK